MAITSETITLVSSRTKVMHRSSGTRFSVQIDLVGGSPPEAAAANGILIVMHKMRGGVLPTLGQVTNFISMTRGQCIPVGSVRAQVQGFNSIKVDYTVRTGNDA